jgi:hypothetical protein
MRTVDNSCMSRSVLGALSGFPWSAYTSCISLALLSSALSPCTPNTQLQSEPIVYDYVAERALTVDEAARLVPFKIVFPAYLPPGASGDASSELLTDYDGRYSLLTDYSTGEANEWSS